ncbi:MAG TPA: hypothetical protein VMR25_23730, partial [Planctomycetaceae bacterium]|nr:hypothetical protein [Planctomycetaceae bacterium]
RIRLHVRQIKQLASQFAQEADDPYLIGLVDKAFEREAATTLKRRTGQTAVQASAPTAIPESADSDHSWFRPCQAGI